MTIRPTIAHADERADAASICEAFIGLTAWDIDPMKANAAHRLERWEYDAGRDLIAALIDDDRHRFDDCLTSWDADRPEVHADLMGLALSVAEAVRYSYPVVHLRPSAAARTQVLEMLGDSEFSDLIDQDLAQVMLDRLYQRVWRDPMYPSVDLISMTTCLAICAWRLWNRRGGFPLDRTKGWQHAYGGVTAAMRLRGFGVYEWQRRDPSAFTG